MSRVTPAAAGTGFIPSIEGLRALAVLVVLLFHLDIPDFSAGYLGVDLFFVISGFIISRNILTDLTGGTFTLKGFYIRRFRRLFPALLVTVLITLLVALLALPPIELEKAAKSAIYAVFSLANFNFWMEAGYFDAAASTKPLLHTWSLSVEEQFYLFWPALLVVLSNSRLRVIATVLLLLGSLMISLQLRDAMPSGVFYMLPFRLHQLMAGALIGMLSLRLVAVPASAATLLASVGFVVTAILLSDYSTPAIGAVLVTVFGFFLLLGRDSALAQSLYSNKPMLWVGQRSYAIYLTHWPIIVLFKYFTDFELNAAEQALLLVLSIASAMALHRCVEKPLRKRGEDTTRAQKMATPIMASLLVVTVGVAAALWRFEGLPSRMDSRIQAVIDTLDTEKRARKKAIRFGVCNLHKGFTISDYDVGLCATPDPSRKNVLVIGDSMAADTYMMLAQSYPEIHFLQATAGACTAILEITEVGGKYEACTDLNEYRFRELVDKDIDLIVLASIWTNIRVQPLKETVEYLQARGKNVLVIGPRAVFSAAVPLLLAKQTNFDDINRRLREQVNLKKPLLERMRVAMPDVNIVDISSIQCSPHCEPLEGDDLLYFDAQHLTELGARRVGERFTETVDLSAIIEGAGQQKSE